MPTLTHRRLDPSVAEDRLAWREVFRGAPSFTHATEGRTPTDADADRMMDTVPKGRTSDDIFLQAIYADGVLCGCSYVARHYPTPADAYLVLLVLMESHQRSYLGIRCLNRIEAQAAGWGCSQLRGVVDAANERAFRFWQRLGFQEERRQRLPGLVGEAVVGSIPIGPVSNERSSAARLRRKLSR
ncbi:GNAT family N-acetyltransferase [Ramlibacter sp. XY19]|uniref:GNAT family N-acetyltransferase n=1 Tax=Ramlibacter paludis TaxID=2908000 RepID=UPI0023DC5879|nr:GNAT family N-acetyltransferase [Ramlibacter paludis]MCG2592896.1 GNAT family N-acetyltransferase [Ramlibacter paludis]